MTSGPMEPVVESGPMETIKPVERAGCWFDDCPNLADHEPCCSSHGHPLCHRCYRRTHFVEVCRCSRPECVKELHELRSVVCPAARVDEPDELVVPRELLESLADPDDCWFDHHGGCQAHGYISLQPGEECPQHELNRRLAVRDV